MSSIETWSPAPTYTVATLPTAGTAGRQAFVSNAGTKGSFWYDDGTRWKPLNGSCLLASLESVSSSIANSETIVFQYQMPAGLWQVGDRLRFAFSYLKSGTTDTGQVIFRVGTAGTTGDTSILTVNALPAAYRQTGIMLDMRLESATSARLMASSRLVAGYGGYAAAALDAAATISSATSNALYVNVGIASTSTNDTVQLADAQLSLIAKAN